MPKELDLEKVSRIKGMREGRSVTRARVKTITFALLNGPPASRTDQRKNYSITCAYTILRPTLYRDERGAYLRKHKIHSAWITRAEKDISEGKASFIDGEFVRDELPPKLLIGRHQKLFDDMEDYLEAMSSTLGRLDPDMVRRMMYIKHRDRIEDNEQVLLKSLKLSGDETMACKSFMSVSTVKRLLKVHGIWVRG